MTAISRRAWVSALAIAALLATCTEAASPESSPSSVPPTGTSGASGGTVGGPAVDTAARVTVAGVLAHLEALQAIADEHDGNRSVGTQGYEASVEYVIGVLRDAGYRVQTPTTEVPAFGQDAPSVLERLEPAPAAWVDGEDFRAMLFSASGDVQAPIATIEGDGCSSTDFAGFPDGAVALVGPGECFRRDQVGHAQAAGAVGFVGVTTAEAGRPLRPTLITPEGIDVPVLAVTALVGAELDDGDVVHLSVRASTTFESSKSVIASLPDGASVDVVMLGGHLDSALDGPGINDNGSGVALLLELARWIARSDPSAPVRFAFWAGEEVGLYGSRDYVDGLDAAGLDAIRVYLNLDMLASPNFASFVYEASPADPAQARRVAELLEDALASRGFESEPLDLSGVSDHAPFGAAGVATGGIYAGSLEHKTRAQADAFGGNEGELLDPCYHQSCDTIANVNPAALRRHAFAIVSVLLALLGQ